MAGILLYHDEIQTECMCISSRLCPIRQWVPRGFPLGCFALFNVHLLRTNDSSSKSRLPAFRNLCAAATTRHLHSKKIQVAKESTPIRRAGRPETRRDETEHQTTSPPHHSPPSVERPCPCCAVHGAPSRCRCRLRPRWQASSSRRPALSSIQAHFEAVQLS